MVNTLGANNTLKVITINGYHKNPNFTSNDYYKNNYMMSLFPKYWYFLTIGSRGRGKTFSGKRKAIKYILKSFKKGDIKKFMWWRLTTGAIDKMCENGGASFLESELLEHYKILSKIEATEIYFALKSSMTLFNGEEVYDWKHVGKVAAIQRYGDFKGNHFNEYDLIIMDELVRAESEKKTFNIPRAFINMIESVCRKRKGVKVLIFANAINEMQEIKQLFGFMPFPGKYGVYKLYHKRAVIEYLDDSKEWKKSQKETMAGVLATASEFTNVHTTNLDEKDDFFIKRKDANGRKYWLSLKINNGLWLDIHHWNDLYYIDTNNYTNKSNQYEQCYALDRTLTSEKAKYSKELIKALQQLWDVNKFRFSSHIVYDWFTKALEKYSII